MFGNSLSLEITQCTNTSANNTYVVVLQRPLETVRVTLTMISIPNIKTSMPLQWQRNNVNVLP